MVKKLSNSIVAAVLIILAFIVIDFMGVSPNIWMRISLFVLIGILIVFVQLKYNKRES